MITQITVHNSRIWGRQSRQGKAQKTVHSQAFWADKCPIKEVQDKHEL